MLVLWCALVAAVCGVEESEVPTSWASDYQQPRASWTPLRIQVVYNATSVSDTALFDLQSRVVPDVVRWYGKVLWVPKTSSLLKVPQPYCAQGVVPQQHQTFGVDADVIIYIVTVPYYYRIDDVTSYGTPCLVSATVPKRVVAGSVWLQMDWFEDLALTEKFAIVARHFAQVLAFHSMLFPHFNKPDGTLYSLREYLKHDSFANGVLNYYLTFPSVVKLGREAFNCPSLPGVRINDVWASMLFWSARMMFNDFMADLRTSTSPSGYSDVTFAVFQDSGWYDVQWRYTTPVQFGRGRGCGLFQTPCVASGQTAFPEFCVAGNNLCSPTLTASGFCRVITFQYGVPSPYHYLGSSGGLIEMDYCPVVEAVQSCLEGTAVGTDEKCAGCRCMAGDYRPAGQSSPGVITHCQRVSCRDNKAFITVGTQEVECSAAGGQVTISGYDGTLTCPPVEQVCAPAPCKNFCSGYGVCDNGTCRCESGHSGSDCSVTCYFTCESCSGLTQSQCTACRPGATLTGGQCVCDSGLSMNADGVCEGLGTCHSSCKTCSGPGATDCTSCRSPAALDAGECQCAEGSVLSLAGACVACSAACRTCQYPQTTSCLSCYGDSALSAGTCTCSDGTHFDPLLRKCKPCDSSCATCSGAPAYCLSCGPGLTANSGVCGCTSGYYLNIATCDACHATCQECSGPLEDDCLLCRPDAYIQSLPGKCLCRTPASTNCMQCDPLCKSCQPPNTFFCTSCYDNAKVDPFTQSCECNVGFFPDPDPRTCVACHTMCATCFAAGPEACTSCPDNSQLSGSQCYCKDRFYLDKATQQCQQCPHHCAYCKDSYCTSCDYGFGFDGDHVCTLQDGYYYHAPTNKAYPCPSLCKTCTGPTTATVCTACMYQLTLNTAVNACSCGTGFYFDWNLKTCEECSDPKCLECPSADSCSRCVAPLQGAVRTSSDPALQCWCALGFFLSASQCELCHPHCQTCHSAARNACRTCFEYSTLTNTGYCRCNLDTAETNCETCDDGVIDCGGSGGGGGGGAICHSTCQTCTASGFANCVSCYPTGVLDDGTCPCSPNIQLGDQCRRCPATCLECNSSGGCSACYNLANIVAPNFGVCVCVRSYPNPTAALCSSCHKTCKECTGPLPTHCTACNSPAVLLADGTCVCRGLHYPMDNGNCFYGSYFCSNPRCLQCKNAAFQYGLWQDADQQFFGHCQCYQPTSTQTRVGKYPDDIAGICHSCSSLCVGGCSKFVELCWSCVEHAITSPLTPLSTSTGNCVCVRGYYPVKEGCIKCPAGCLYCDSQGKCDQCLSGYELQVQSRTCVCVAATCKCASGTFLLKQTNLCEVLCPSGFTGVEGECKDSGATKFTFTFDRVAKSFLDSTGHFTLYAGDPQDPESQPNVLYQRGLHFASTGYSYVRLNSNAAQGANQLVLAPTHYMEMWIKASYYSLVHDVDDSTTWGVSRLQYEPWWANLSLRDVFGAVKTTSLSMSFNYTESWILQRFEFITTPKGAGFVTRIRVSSNNVLVAEQTVLEYYYRDGPFDFNSTYFMLSMNADSVFKSYLAEFTIANRQWSAESAAPCGCSQCTVSGFCLSSCSPAEFPKQGGLCGQCQPSCDKGCVRETDCNLNLDPLCASWTTFTNCTGCKSLASIVAGACTCNLHSTFRPENNTCTCDPNYQLSPEGVCVMCLNYFAPDQVTVNIDDDFMSMTLTFAQEVQAPSSDNCASYFMPETFKKFGSGATCTWSENAKQLKVLFGSGATMMVDEVLLDNTKLLRKSGTCSFSSSALRPVAKYSGLMPVPAPVLSAPASVALDCSATSTLQLSSLGTTGGKGRDLQYKWAFQHATMGALFPQYANYSDQSLVTLPVNTLTAGNLTVVLTTKNKFGKEASVSQTVELKGGRALLVELETGPSLNITSQDQGQVKAFIRDTCGMTGDRRFSWTYVGANSTLPDTAKDPALLLRASKVPYALSVEKGSLTAGYSYTFEVVAEQAAITGTARLTITVLRSPLVLRLNRMSGSHPSDMTLRLDASLSVDPDKLSGTATYLWTCSDGTGACLDVNGTVLLADPRQESYAFAPQVLRPSAKYNFTVTVAKDVRTVTGSILIGIVAPTGCSIVLKPVAETINSHWEYAILPSIDTSLETDFLWKQVVGPAVTPASKPEFAFLAFRANTLQGGQSYSFELNAKTVKGTIIALFGFTVNRAPIGGKAALQPNTGRALIDNFLLYTESWEDPEANYPLSYQFCLSKNGNEPYCLSGGQSKPWQNSKLYKGTLTLSARAFDNLGGRGECSLTINIASPGRLLDTFDAVASFKSDIEDAENTYAMTIAYSESLTAADSFFKTMMWAVGNYTATVFAVTPQVLDSYLGAALAMSGQAVARQPGNALPLLQALNGTVGKYASALTSAELSRAVAVVTSVAANSTEEVRVEAARVLVALTQLYNAQRLPNEGTFAASSAEVSVISQRATAAALAQMNLTLDNLTVTAAAGWLSDLPGTDILDLYVTGYNSSLSWTVQVLLQRAGSYSNYNLQFASPVNVTKLAKPLNVSVPCSMPENVEVECVGLTETGQWSTDVCEVLEVRKGSVLVSTTVLSTVTVQQKLPEAAIQEPVIPQVVRSSDCDINPAPLSIAAALLILCVTGAVLRFYPQLIRKAPAVQEHIPDVSASDMNALPANPDTSFVDGEQKELKTVERKDVRDQTTRAQLAQVTEGSNLFTFHLLFRGLVKREDLPRCVCIVASTALVQMVVLGLCYELWDDSSDKATDAAEVFSQYSEKDLRYVGIALGLGALVSSALQVCRWPAAANIAAAIVSACAFGGITYLNSDMCYSEGGRWGEGALWTLLLQFLIVESVKALGLLTRDKLRTK